MTTGLGRWTGFAMWAVFAALLGWYLIPPPERTEETRLALRDAWQLPSLPARRTEPERAAAAGAAPFWGVRPEAAAAGTAPVPPAATWRLAGVVGKGNSRRVLLLYMPDGAKPSVLLKVGDPLPDGQRIREINDTSIRVQIGKQSQVMWLQPMEPGP